MSHEAVVMGKLRELAESSQWAPYCSDIGNEIIRLTTAAVLENTRNTYEHTDPTIIGREPLYALVKATLLGVSTHHISSFQPSLHAISPVFYLSRDTEVTQNNIPEVNLRLESAPLITDNRRISVTSGCSFSSLLSLRERRGDEMLTDMLSGMSHELCTGIDSIVIREIWDGAVSSTENTITNMDDILSVIIEASGKLMQSLYTISAVNVIVSSLIYENLIKHCGGGIFNSLPTPGFQSYIYHVGNISNRFEVFVNPHFSDENILFCGKGESFLDCGHIFSPYTVLLRESPGLHTMSQRRSVSLLYGSHMVNPNYFCKGTLELINPTVMAEDIERPKYYRKLNIQYE